MKRRRHRHGRASAPGLRSALLRARADGAAYVEAGGGRHIVFRPGSGGKWQAAMVKRTSDGLWYTTPWEIAPLGGWLPDSAQSIDDAIRRAA